MPQQKMTQQFLTGRPEDMIHDLHHEIWLRSTAVEHLKEKNTSLQKWNCVLIFLISAPVIFVTVMVFGGQ
jgi:hypothetical protein